MNVAQFLAALMIIVTITFAMIRSFGSSVAYFYRLLLACARGRVFDALFPVIIVGALGALGFALISSYPHLLLPVQGQTYPELPALRRAGEWLINSLSELTPQLPPLP